MLERSERCGRTYGRCGSTKTSSCGGTHHDNLGEIGEVRIVKTSQVQDGVERLQIVAGETAREYARMQEQILNETSELLGVSHEDLPKTVSRFFEEWKMQQKRIEDLEGEIIRLRTSGSSNEAIILDGIKYVIMEVTGDSKQMMSMLGELTRNPEEPTLAVIGSRHSGGKLIVAMTEESIVSEKYDAIKILNSISKFIKGGGGGTSSFAQGGGSNPDGIKDALDQARKILGLK